MATSSRPVSTAAPTTQLGAFLAKFEPAMAKDARAALARMGKLLPAGAVRMVYDNWNGLVVGFGPNERPSDAIVSILVVADHISLCFINDGPSLPDPDGLLRGRGTVVRHVRLTSAADLDRPPVKALIEAAIAQSDVPFARGGPSKLIIRSISPKQRPRRKAG